MAIEHARPAACVKPPHDEVHEWRGAETRERLEAVWDANRIDARIPSHRADDSPPGAASAPAKAKRKPTHFERFKVVWDEADHVGRVAITAFVLEQQA